MDNSKSFSEKRLHVLQIISAPLMGGIENQLLAFLQRYNRDRFVVDVVCGLSTEGPLRDKYLATGTRLIFCRWSRYIIPYAWRLFRLLRRGRYDVVHARSAEVSGVAILAARLAGVPNRIASYHHTKINWRRPGLMNRLVVGILQRITRRWATKILSISEACFDVYYPDWRQHRKQFQVCYNGIDVERFSGRVIPSEVRSELGLPRDSLVVGHVGSFRKAKNHQTFIDVAEHVSKQLENVYFLLVGDGALRGKIEREVTKRGLSSRFVFTGNRDDVPRMLAAMDVFLMPSLYEGFGTVVIEAQMRELPVVASDIPCIREALCPGMQDFFFDVHDDKGMAEQIKILLENPEWCHRLGREGREYVIKRFLIDKTVEQLESVYNSGLDQASIG